MKVLNHSKEDKMKLVKILLFVVVFCLFLLTCKHGGSYPLKQETCYIAEIGEEVICGTYMVRENPYGPARREIALNFIILPARGSNKVPDPVFAFSGGPGAGAAASVVSWASMLEKLRQERDIVLVDLRGTGQSNPLYCPPIGDVNSAQSYLTDMYPEDYVKNCRSKLKEKADLRQYHHSISLDDIDALRAELGYEQINVVGGSGGSRAGYVYMNRYPGRVRCAFLWAIAPPDQALPSTMAQDAEAALMRLFADCAADPDCAADYPTLQQEFYQILNRLKAGPVTVSITNPINNQPETVTFSHNNFITGIRYMLYSSSTSRWLPAFIFWAARGTYFPLVEYTVDYLYWINRDVMEGLYLCMTCTEDIPYVDFAVARAQAQGTFLGIYRLDQQQAACEWWVRGQLEPGFFDRIELNIPTLIVSGENDPVTPPYYGEHLANSLPNSLHVIVPNSGHSKNPIWDNCLDDAVAQFVSRGAPEGIDFTCAYNYQRPPFVSWRDYTMENKEKISAQVKTITSRLQHAAHAPY
jgi:pimeloyl-ACP methyl ester carboxylesterase